MAEAPARRSALARVGPTVAPDLAERAGLALIHLVGRPARAGFLGAARGVLGVNLPLVPNTTARTDQLTVFWLAPTRWLIACEESAGAEVETRLRAACASGVTDVSGGRVAIRIAGGSGRRKLASDCPIDLHPRSLPPGTAVQTMLAGTSVMLHALPDRDAFDIYVPRSYAVAVWEWLAKID